MTLEDPVREFLEERGCPEDLVAGGLDGLIAGWERVARQVETGYPLGLDDYLNDLDARQLLEDAMELAPPSERALAAARVQAADSRIRHRVRMVGECLWGARVAASEGWTTAANWWYFAVPQHPGPMLQEDLDASE